MINLFLTEQSASFLQNLAVRKLRLFARVSIIAIFSGACPVSFNVRREIFFYKILSEPNYTHPSICQTERGTFRSTKKDGQNWIGNRPVLLKERRYRISKYDSCVCKNGSFRFPREKFWNKYPIWYQRRSTSFLGLVSEKICLRKWIVFKKLEKWLHQKFRKFNNWWLSSCVRQARQLVLDWSKIFRIKLSSIIIKEAFRKKIFSRSKSYGKISCGKTRC